MTSLAETGAAAAPSADPGLRFRQVRAQTLALCGTLSAEDCALQSMPSASPLKWHLAHTSWFFERFILRDQPAYRCFDEYFDYLFNSYYNSVGRMHPRAERGLLSRPALERVLDYRRHVEETMLQLLETEDPALSGLLELGLQHEQQHQELMLTDIKHLFSCNPLKPAVTAKVPPRRGQVLPELGWHDYPGGIREIGHSGNGFCFDNETPRHRVLLEDFALASRLVSNAEYLAFINDGGYRRSELWLADGWAWLQAGQIAAPLYWDEQQETCFTLAGMQPLDPEAPVCHVSFYEADAYARWAGHRLPGEAEWEVAASGQAPAGNFADRGYWHPEPLAESPESVLLQLYGDVWEWTASPYAAWPGFKPLAGSLGEYNGKFMCNQMVCRGGSCVTPAGHVRSTYRNFFYPHERWQFFGIRLARSQ